MREPLGVFRIVHLPRVDHERSAPTYEFGSETSSTFMPLSSTNRETGPCRRAISTVQADPQTMACSLPGCGWSQLLGGTRTRKGQASGQDGGDDGI